MIFDRLNLIGKEAFIDFLISVDNDFNPPLNRKLKFDEYYEKICELGKFLCIVERGRIRGMVIYYDNLDIAQITLVAVNRLDRGVGVASKLLELVVNEAHKPIRVITWRGNDSAIHLYEKFGFNIIGSNVNKYGTNELIMERA